MGFKPLYDRVVVKRDEAETVTDSGLFIPENAKEKPLVGTVISVGHGRLTERGIETLCTTAGDKVLFGRYSGTEVEVEGQEVLIMREDEILGILD